MKVVISITDNRIVTVWGNKVSGEKEKQKNLNTRYTNINILSLK